MTRGRHAEEANSSSGIKGANAPRGEAPKADKNSGAVQISAEKGREEQMSFEAEPPKSRKTSKQKPQKSKAPERLKCSLLLTRENDLRLTVLASVKGTDRSALINAILDDALRGVVVSLRGALANEGGAGGGVQESDAEAP